MKTLCIKSWRGFEEGQVYDFYINDNGYNVCCFSNVYTTFQDDDIFVKCYHNHFSHKIYERQQKLL